MKLTYSNFKSTTDAQASQKRPFRPYGAQKQYTTYLAEQLPRTRKVTSCLGREAACDIAITV
jgi:hypothetical protein